MAKITVADALVRIKTIKVRIVNEQKVAFVAINDGGRIAGFKNAGEFSIIVQAGMQSVTALIRNYSRLKSAIVESNARTVVQIGKESMTVAAAIERKTSIQQEKDFLGLLAAQWTQVRRTVDTMQMKVQQQAEQQALALYGNKADKTGEDFMKFVDLYVRNNGAAIIDPLGLEQIVKQLTLNIQEFEANVDLALTTSNVMTEIEVDLT